MEPLTKRPFLQELPSDKRKLVCEVLQELVLTDQQIQQLMRVFEEQIYFANNPDPEIRKKTDLWWGYTFVNGVLEGNENGRYMGLDLGGTNFRVVMVKLTNGEANARTEYYTIPPNLLTDTAEKLFDHIADSIEQFLTEEEIDNDSKPIPLGFSFSFLLSQTSLKHSKIRTWGKSFKCTTGPGLDPCVLLEDAIARRGGLSISVEVVARIGDSTGTLMAGRNADKNCMAGLILGTGSNVCIVEYRNKYKKQTIEGTKADQILVDTEFGALGDNGCLDFMKNEFERDVNTYSSYPGNDTFEKSFSGMFIGELVRLCLVKLIRKQLLFGGYCSESLSTRWSLEAKHVSSIERDNSSCQQNTKEVLKEFQMDKNCMVDDINLVREVCFLVSQRGAYLLGSALAVLLRRMDKSEISVAVDGSLYEHHPNYHNHIISILRQLIPDVKRGVASDLGNRVDVEDMAHIPVKASAGKRVKLFLLKDGSGKGAAFVAAVAKKET